MPRATNSAAPTSDNSVEENAVTTDGTSSENTASEKMAGRRLTAKPIITEDGRVNIGGLDVLDIASAVYDFLATTRRLCERPITQLGSSQSEVEVLHFVFNHPGCGVSEIARLRFLRASNVSATVRRLINDGLLERRANESDKRSQELYVTESGKEVLDELASYWAVLIAQATSHMPEGSVAILRRGVGALNELTGAAELLIDDMQRNPEIYDNVELA